MKTFPFPKKDQDCVPDSSRSAGRLNLPVAPRANVRTKFASTGVTAEAMMPTEAASWLNHALEQGICIQKVGLAGPGDALADPGPAIETLGLIRAEHPEIELGVTTVGLGGEQHAGLLAENSVGEITLLVDAIDPEMVKKLYAWIRPGAKTLPLDKTAGILVDEQARAVSAFKKAGLKVNIRTTVYAGHNDDHIEEVAGCMAGLGAETMTVVPFKAVSEDQDRSWEPDRELMAAVREQAAKHVQVVEVYEKSVADMMAFSYAGDSVGQAAMQPKASSDRPNVAVVSSDGMDIDLHLGHAVKALIYGPREDGLASLLETRTLPEPGGGSSRWEKLAETLADCFVLLAASAGDNPKKILSRHGISVIITDDNIEGTVDVLYGGGKKGKKCRR